MLPNWIVWDPWAGKKTIDSFILLVRSDWNKYFISVFKTKDTVAYSYWLKAHFHSNIWTLYWNSESETGEERMNFKEESSRSTTFWAFRKKCSLLALWMGCPESRPVPQCISFYQYYLSLFPCWCGSERLRGTLEVTQKAPAGIRKTARVLDCRLLDATDGWPVLPPSSEPCLNITPTSVPRSPELRWRCKEKFEFCVSWAFKPRKYFCP